ncbi:hypothetical protein [Chryseobacterium sp.]|uniref:hypothetical protein n=1 Tax=Chryseobacterium sp. TaxID=1871047 RepID=UPI002631E1A6|nr:hypothetical protein [Chryseobacterium sp.]
MKRVFLISAILFSSFIYSQEFIITYENYKSKEDPSKDYIILEYPGKAKEELYKMTKKYINSKYIGSKDYSFSEVEDEQIVIDVLSRDYRRIWINLSGGNLWKVSNRYEFNFKDGKLMIRPSFSNFTNTENNSKAGIGIMYNSSGQLKKENIAAFTEALANTFVRDFKKGLEENKSNDW